MKAKAEIAVIDYGMGNLRSVLKAWEHAGAAPRLVLSPRETEGARGLVFPGQGAIVDTMALLKKTGFDRLIEEWIRADRPYLGICLGLQALFEHSEEGNTPCLGLFPGRVKRFRFPPEAGLKIPHMGWNAVSFRRQTPLSKNLAPAGDQFYFVHSYRAAPEDDSLVWGETDYGGIFTSAIARGRCYATQFHPEKSQVKGLQIYRNFLELALQS